VFSTYRSAKGALRSSAPSYSTSFNVPPAKSKPEPPLADEPSEIVPSLIVPCSVIALNPDPVPTFSVVPVLSSVALKVVSQRVV